MLRVSSYLSRLYAGDPFQELKAAAKGAPASDKVAEAREKHRLLRAWLACDSFAWDCTAPAIGWNYWDPFCVRCGFENCLIRCTSYLTLGQLDDALLGYTVRFGASCRSSTHAS